MSESQLIDWALAERIARTLAGTGTGKRSVRQIDLRRAARGSVGLVRDYTGLQPKGKLPSAEVVDRREWIGANIESLRSMSGGVEQSLANSLDLPGPVGSSLRTAAGVAAAVELGLVSAYLAQRVLGQYDVALIGPSRPPRLLFVAPNLAEAQRRLGAERRPFLRWVALHEATHVVQFGAVP
jgi:putative hydrolase